MPKTYTVTEYDKDDIEALDSMSKSDVIETLERIKRGWLPQDYVCSPRNYETYSESQYDITKLHIAMRKAITMLENIKDEED